MDYINRNLQIWKFAYLGILKILFLLGWLMVFLLNAGKAAAQENGFRVFLVGDAGEDAITGTTLKNLQRALIGNPKSAVIFLGDNSYRSSLGGIIPFGFKGFDSSGLTQKKVRSQLDILSNYKGSVYFIPGNHDWWNRMSYASGKRKLKLEESFIEENLQKNDSILNAGNTFFPKQGRPGPDFVELNDHKLRIIFIDSYRLILPGFRKDQPDTALSEGEFYKDLDSLLQEATFRHQKIIVAAHHPVYPGGPHYKLLKNYHVLTRIKASNGNFPSYKTMSQKIRAILQKYPGTYYASGHVHGLDYIFASDSIHYIISGAGSKIIKVSKKDLGGEKPTADHEFSMWNSKGFFELDFSRGADRIFLYYDEGKQKCELPFTW
jgi:DNA repair exonuclease SbcCD nuclease subunit